MRLEEYGPCLVSQGYSTVQEVATISIEDLEVSSHHWAGWQQSSSWNINIQIESFPMHFPALLCSQQSSAVQSVLASRGKIIIISPRRTRASTGWDTRSG